MRDGLNLKSRDNLSAHESSDPSPMYVRKFRVLPFCSASAKSKFHIFVQFELPAKIATLSKVSRPASLLVCLELGEPFGQTTHSSERMHRVFTVASSHGR